MDRGRNWRISLPTAIFREILQNQGSPLSRALTEGAPHRSPGAIVMAGSCALVYKALPFVPPTPFTKGLQEAMETRSSEKSGRQARSLRRSGIGLALSVTATLGMVSLG